MIINKIFRLMAKSLSMDFNKLDNGSINVHLLPCIIAYDGKAEVYNYFTQNIKPTRKK